MNSGDIAGVVVSSIFMVSFAAVLILRGPLGKAWVRRIEGARAVPDATAAAAVEELQGQVAELEARVDRMHELEERLDFTERLLAQQREQAQFPVPRDRR